MTADPTDSWDTPATVSGEFVTIERALEMQDGGVIATLSAAVDGDESVDVRIVEPIPDGWPVEEIGLHPEFEPRGFSADESVIAIEDTVEPGTEFEVVYGLRLEGDGNLDPPGDPLIDHEAIASTGSGLGDGLLAGDGSGAEGLDRFSFSDSGDGEEGVGGAPAPDSPFGESGGTLADDSAFSDPFGLSEEGNPLPGDRSEPGLGRAAVGDRSIADGDMGEFVSRLADEIESGSVPDEDVTALREALGGEAARSTAARLDHLNSRVEEFGAYLPFLRDLIDEHGSAEAFLDHLGALRDEVGAVREAQEEGESERDDLRRRMSEVTDDLVELEERLSSRLDGIRRDLETVHGSVDDLTGLDDRVDALEGDLADGLGGIRSDVSSLESSVDEWRETRDALAATLRDTARSSTD